MATVLQRDAPRPEPDEAASLAFLDRVDDEIRAWAKDSKFEEQANTWERFREGSAWPATTPGGRKPIFDANILGNLIERKVASLTQSKPDFLVAGRKPGLEGPSHIYTMVSRAILDENQLDARIERAADMAATYGFVGFNTAWDPWADYGNGNIITRVIHPRHLGVDRNVLDTTELHKAAYLTIDTPMPLVDIRRIWPGRGALVKPNPAFSVYEKAGRQTVSWWRGVTRPLERAGRPESPYPYALVREYWLRSEQLDPDTAQLRYPTGRVIHRAGDVILDEGPNPYWDGGWPIDVWDWRLDVNSFAGRSDVDALRKLQEAFSRFGDAVVQNALVFAVISVVAEHDALTPEGWKALDDRVARIIKTQRNRKFEIQPPPEIPASYFMLFDAFQRMMETIVGVPQASQGNRQEGVVAASAVEGLQVAAETLVRSCARRLEYVIERIGQKLISRITQFYTTDRVLTLLGDSSNWQSYAFERAKLLSGNEGSMSEEEKRAYFTNFQFRVTPLSSLPMNKTQRALLSMKLLEAGLIDGIEVLKQAEYPNYEAVYARAQKANAENAAAMEEKMMKAALLGVKLPSGGGGGGASSNRRGTTMNLGG